MFEFAWPWLFLLLPLPWLLRRVLPPTTPGQALHLPQPGLRLAEASGNAVRSVAPWLLALAWLCLVAAAARPQWVGPPQAQQRSGRALFLAVDLSGSMRTPDMELAGQSVSRFGAVKAIAGNFIDRRRGDEMGLILFGSQAFLVTPLTYDLDAVRTQLQGAAVGLAGTETAIGDAIAIAVKRLSALPEQARVLVLLTDGVNTAGNVAPLDAAKLAKAAGVRIYTIGVGSDAQALGMFGMQLPVAQSELDVQALTQIADQTGGHFFRAADGDQLAAAYRTIDALEPLARGESMLRPDREWYPWPLGMALLLGCTVLPWRVERSERRADDARVSLGGLD